MILTQYPHLHEYICFFPVLFNTPGVLFSILFTPSANMIVMWYKNHAVYLLVQYFCSTYQMYCPADGDVGSSSVPQNQIPHAVHTRLITHL